jgi:hypothetical protein
MTAAKVSKFIKALDIPLLVLTYLHVGVARTWKGYTATTEKPISADQRKDLLQLLNVETYHKQAVSTATPSVPGDIRLFLRNCPTDLALDEVCEALKCPMEGITVTYSALYGGHKGIMITGQPKSIATFTAWHSENFVREALSLNFKMCDKNASLTFTFVGYTPKSGVLTKYVESLVKTIMAALDITGHIVQNKHDDGSAKRSWVLYATPEALALIGSIGTTFVKGIDCVLPFKRDKIYQADKAQLSFCFPKGITHVRDNDVWFKATAAIATHDEIINKEFPSKPVEHRSSKSVPMDILLSLGF